MFICFIIFYNKKIDQKLFFSNTFYPKVWLEDEIRNLRHNI